MHIVQPGMEIDVLKENNKIAHENYRLMRSKGIKSVDFMGSIGAGKTALIIKLAEKLRAKGVRVCAIAGDVTGADDYTRFEKSGLHSVNCNTGHECHLDANLVKKTLADINLDDYDVIFIENVGNLVCPVDFDLGENLAVMILSVPEGDDNPLKYPGIFQHAGALLLNKIDVAPAFEFDMEEYARVLDDLNPAAPRFSISATRGTGMDVWVTWLAAQMGK